MPFDVIRRSPAVQCALAVLAAALAVGVRLSLASFFADRNQLLMFYPAIMFSAWMGGLWPGVVATLASAALVAYFFLEPVFTLRFAHPGDALALAVFVATGIIISSLYENLRRNAAQEHKARSDADQARAVAERARAEADTANRTKDFFMAAVSHDLRAPIVATLGWADILSKHMLDSEQHARAVEAIRRAVNHQMVLADDLLDTAAILAGKLRMTHAPVDLDRVLRDAVDLAESLGTRKRVRIGAEYDETQTVVMGDSTRLQQVIDNLLTNAIKFTPEGGAVRVTLKRTTRIAEIDVIDTGRGIPADALPLVFEAFWQGDGSPAARRDSGVGLGLSIAKHLVVAHGGTIDVASDGDGKGATFTVRLPLAAAPVLAEPRSGEPSRV